MRRDRVLPAVAALFLGAAVLCVLLTGLRLTFTPAGLLVAALPPVLLLAVCRRGWLGDAAWYGGMLLVVLLAGSVASYAAASASRGFVDPVLARWDQALGFDWPAWHQAVAARPMLQAAGRLAYRSIYISPVLLLGWFAWAGRGAAARRLVLRLAVALAGAVAGSWLWPAMGAYAFWKQVGMAYRPITSDEPLNLITALRDGTAGIVDLGIDQGIICLPSFHTSCALLYIGSAWRIPGLRLVVVPLNLLMLAATPVEGSHYIVDILAGGLLAALAAAIVALSPTVGSKFGAKEAAMTGWFHTRPPRARP